MVKFPVKFLRLIVLAGLVWASTLFGSDFDLTNSSLEHRLQLRSALEAGQTIRPSADRNHLQASADDSQRKQLKRRKSRAFLRSVLIPGWGQFTEGNRMRGYSFLTAEVLLISGIIGVRTQAAWLEQDYQAFARQHAGIQGDLDHQLYVDIGNWANRRSYNERRLRDRDYEAVYTSPSQDWNWDSEQNRLLFKDQRIAADQARQTSILLVGGVLLNHIIAGIEAGQSTKLEAQGVTLQATFQGHPGVSLRVRNDWLGTFSK